MSLIEIILYIIVIYLAVIALLAYAIHLVRKERQYEVHCGRCKWWGQIRQLKSVYVPNPLEPGDVMSESGCPVCESCDWLEYRED